MKICPNCGKVTRVVDTMTDELGNVRRIRECADCFQRWETVEHVVPDSDKWSFSNLRPKKRRTTNENRST